MDDAREFPVKVKPTLYLSEEDIPDIGDVQVGDRVNLQVSAKIKSISQGETEKNKESFSYTFEISGVNVDSGLKKTSDGFSQALDGRRVK